MGYAYAVTGQRAKAEQLLRDVEALADQHQYASAGTRVYVYVGLGDKEKAYEWLDRAYDDLDWSCFFLKIDPAFDPLRQEPRFQALLKKVFPDP